MFIQLEKIGAGEWLASSEAELLGPGLGQLIHDAQDFNGAELLAYGSGAIEAIGVAHDAM